jgi:hypothetical protein
MSMLFTNGPPNSDFTHVMRNEMQARSPYEEAKQGEK